MSPSDLSLSIVSYCRKSSSRNCSAGTIFCLCNLKNDGARSINLSPGQCRVLNTDILFEFSSLLFHHNTVVLRI